MKNCAFCKILAVVVLSMASNYSLAVSACANNLKVVGSSSFSVWFWDVYDIQLKTLDGSYVEGKYPLQLELTYQRNIEKDELVSETKNQWKRFNLDPILQKKWLDKLAEIWPNVKQNDQITFRVCETGKTQFLFNDQAIGELEDIEFAKYFSLIWLDPNGPYPKQTSKLLGLSAKR